MSWYIRGAAFHGLALSFGDPPAYLPRLVLAEVEQREGDGAGGCRPRVAPPMPRSRPSTADASTTPRRVDVEADLRDDAPI
jgi:hypothetical protein